MFARFVASYCQEAFIWDAALNAIYEIRVRVFERVLAMDLDVFEGGTGVSSGDIAYRITAEASDVADTVYSLLNVSVIEFNIFLFVHFSFNFSLWKINYMYCEFELTGIN